MYIVLSIDGIFNMDGYRPIIHKLSVICGHVFHFVICRIVWLTSAKTRLKKIKIRLY
jgi:hypothetical protein